MTYRRKPDVPGTDTVIARGTAVDQLIGLPGQVAVVDMDRVLPGADEHRRQPASARTRRPVTSRESQGGKTAVTGEVGNRQHASGSVTLARHGRRSSGCRRGCHGAIRGTGEVL